MVLWPTDQSDLVFINAIINVLNHYSHKCENVQDFNITVQNICLHSFLQSQTCYQSQKSLIVF